MRFAQWRSKTGFYVAYHFVIEPDGKIIQTRELDEWGAHVKPRYENWHIGVCLSGNFNEELPTEPQLDTFKRLLVRLRSEEGITKVKPHRCIQPDTVCCGLNLGDDFGQILMDKEKCLRKKLLERLRGKFILRSEANGELYYISEEDGEVVYLKTPDDMFRVLTDYKIPIGVSEDDFKLLIDEK